jgi:hypothetical protein
VQQAWQSLRSVADQVRIYLAAALAMQSRRALRAVLRTSAASAGACAACARKRFALRAHRRFVSACTTPCGVQVCLA